MPYVDRATIEQAGLGPDETIGRILYGVVFLGLALSGNWRHA